MLGSVYKQNLATLGGEDPSKQASREAASGDDEIETLIQQINAWRTEFHGVHREDRTSCVPSYENRG